MIKKKNVRDGVSTKRAFSEQAALGHADKKKGNIAERRRRQVVKYLRQLLPQQL